MRVAIGAVVNEEADVDFVVQAERLGADSVWVPEAWGHDALTPLAYLAARTKTIRLGTGIVQVGARTPAMLAMSAASMQSLSHGRFLLGLGTSGPQIMEGWHGVAFGSPVQATRETIEIVRMATSGVRVEYEGEVFTVPRQGARAIRSMAPPTTVPMYIAALGPRNLELTGELGDGWIGNAFIPERGSVFIDSLRAGATRSGRSLSEVDLLMPVGVEFTDDFDEAARRHAGGYAFTIGAMGSKTQNFYNAAFARQGFGDDVEAVQQLWLDGHRDQARARVPLEIGWGTNLLGTPPMIKDRLRAYRNAGITTLQAKLSGTLDAKLDTLAQLIELVTQVNGEVNSEVTSEVTSEVNGEVTGEVNGLPAAAVDSTPPNPTR